MSTATEATNHADADVIADATSSQIDSFEVSGPVVVAHKDESSQECQYIEADPANKQVLLEAHYLDQSAFFKLRIPVCLKRLDKTFLYFHLPSHHISSFDWATDSVNDDAADLRLIQGKLNSGGVTRLDFRLHTPGHLIVPGQDLEPRKPATARVIDSLTSLATALSFSLYVPHTVFSKVRLQLLGNAICSPLSTQPQAPANLEDLRSLYNGKGGKRWVPIDDGTASTASDSAASTVAVDTPPGYGPPPPQYDEIEPGSPKQKRRGKRPRHRVSSGSSDGSPSARPSKRAAWGAEATTAFPDEKGDLSRSSRETVFAQMEVLVRAQHEYIQQQQTHILQQQEHIKQQDGEMKRLVATTTELEHQVAVMQERLDEAGSTVENLDAGLLELGEELDEVRCSIPDSDEIVQDLGSQIEHEVGEQLERRLRHVFNRIGNAITDG
ncbi:hypothetical protein PG994_013735 [Apiospora phragmitis]|uniref:Uncharacterized protein n=1 Tax=Apiospora phragmitis TaxID=2905665 RepID=A0ABR1TA33_9PEZI